MSNDSDYMQDETIELDRKTLDITAETVRNSPRHKPKLGEYVIIDLAKALLKDLGSKEKISAAWRCIKVLTRYRPIVINKGIGESIDLMQLRAVEYGIDFAALKNEHDINLNEIKRFVTSIINFFANNRIATGGYLIAVDEVNGIVYQSNTWITLPRSNLIYDLRHALIASHESNEDTASTRVVLALDVMQMQILNQVMNQFEIYSDE